MSFNTARLHRPRAVGKVSLTCMVNIADFHVLHVLYVDAYPREYSSLVPRFVGMILRIISQLGFRLRKRAWPKQETDRLQFFKVPYPTVH